MPTPATGAIDRRARARRRQRRRGPARRTLRARHRGACTQPAVPA